MSADVLARASRLQRLMLHGASEQRIGETMAARRQGYELEWRARVAFAAAMGQPWGVSYGVLLRDEGGSK